MSLIVCINSVAGSIFLCLEQYHTFTIIMSPVLFEAGERRISPALKNNNKTIRRRL